MSTDTGPGSTDAVLGGSSAGAEARVSATPGSEIVELRLIVSFSTKVA